MVPRKPHTSVAVVLAGVSPTRRSAANEGHRVCSEPGTDGLTSAWRAADRWPLMTKIPGQRSPSAEKIAAARLSNRTSISAKPGSRIHRRDRLQPSSRTRSERKVLAER